MIAVDTSSLVAFLEGSSGDDVDLVEMALDQHQLVVPPVVLTEVLSDPQLAAPVRVVLMALPLLDIEQGYWERAGVLRATMLRRGRKARVADALIAQSCLDHAVPLVTRDRNFRQFAHDTGLTLPRHGSAVSSWRR